MVVAILQRAAPGRSIDSFSGSPTPSSWPTRPATRRTSRVEQKRELLETADVEERLTLLLEWAPRATWPSSRSPRRSATTCARGWTRPSGSSCCAQQLAAIRKELGEDEPDGADDYRTRVEAADLPEKVREAALREVGKLERASDQSPEAGWIRTWLDTVLDMPVERAHRGLHRRRRGPRGARRRPPRPRRREGPDRGVPRGPRPARRARPRGRRRPRLRRGAGAGRPARRRQDLARRVGRPRARPQVRPGLARRRPRRGRDPRPPAHVRRRAARPASSGPSARPAR